jgi:hypothetical protein
LLPYEKLKEKFITATNSKSAMPLLDAIFQRLMIDSTLVKKSKEEKLIAVLIEVKAENQVSTHCPD